MSSEELQARKKVLAKQLQEWKANFKEQKGSNPTQSDIDADETIKAIFTEFNAVKKQLEEHANHNNNNSNIVAVVSPAAVSSENQDNNNSAVDPTPLPVVADTTTTNNNNNNNGADAREARKKELTKQLNEWKKAFKAANNDKGPAQSDIDADPAIRAIFEEFTALKKGVAYVPSPAKQQQEQTVEENISSNAAVAENTTASTQQEPETAPQQKQQQQEGPTPTELADARKKELAKTLSEWKANFKETQGKSPAESDIKSDPEIAPQYAEFMVLKKGGSLDEAAAAAQTARNEAIERQNTLKQLAEQAASAADSDKQQQEQREREQQQHQEAAAVADQERKRQLQQHRELEEQKAQDAAVAQATALAATEEQQRQAHEARKKDLAKLLSEWKAKFKETQGKSPAESDIKSDPEVAGMYEEFTSLKKGGSLDEAAAAGETARAEAIERQNKLKQAAEAVVVAAALQQQEQEHQSSSSSPSPTNTDERKKHLTKQLAEWKLAFKEQQGRNPKQSDIEADPAINQLYQEYTLLKSGGGGNAASPSPAAENNNNNNNKQQRHTADENKQQPAAKSVTADELKKQTAKQLADWKADFKTQQGRNPKQSDIEVDPQINIIFQQYTILKGGGTVEEALAVSVAPRKLQQELYSPANAADYAPYNDNENKQQQAPASPTTAKFALEERKKQLARILAEWKLNFRSIHNTNPQQSDVEADLEIKEVYEEYSCLKQGKEYIAPAKPARLDRGSSFHEAIDRNKNNIYGDDDDVDDHHLDGGYFGQEGEHIGEREYNNNDNPGEGFTYTGHINIDNVNNPIHMIDDDRNLVTGPSVKQFGDTNTSLQTGINDQQQQQQGQGSGCGGGGGGGGVTNFLRWLGDGDDKSENAMDVATREHHISMWENATARQKIFTIVEPSSSLVQPYASFQVATGGYHLLYLLLLLSYIAVSLAETVYDGGVNNLIRVLFIGIPNMWFTFDFIIRASTVNEWQYAPMLVADFVSLVTCWIHLSDRRVFANDVDVIRIFPHLRVIRLMLFTRLFMRKDFFRDIEIALLTVQSSLQPLLLFAVLFFVFLVLFSTFIFLTERGEWNDFSLVWERPCRQFVSDCVGVEKSPFQSIPDGLWVTVQVMTTVGLGDTIPTSFWGRVVAGIAMVVGVFVIAFPAMLFISNLEQVRKDYFAQLERERVERAYRLDMIKILQDQQTAADRANMAKAEMTMDLGGTMTSMMNATMNATMNFATLGLKVNKDANMVLFDEAATEDLPAQPLEGPTIATFSFMGHPARQVKKTRRGEFVYEPIMEFLCDAEDGAPVLSSVVEIDDGVYMAQLSLIVDDLVAQELAAEAVVAACAGTDHVPENGVAPRAAGVYALEVTLGSTSVSNIQVVRRIDASKILENVVPVTIEIHANANPGVVNPDEFYDVNSAKETARALLMQTNPVFHISYSRAPVSSAIWQKSVPITSIMLSTTPFVHELMEIAAYASVADLLDTFEKKRAANKTAKRRRHVAFVARHHVGELVYPVFRKVVGKSRYVIRNASHFVEALTNMITLHCRRVRHHEIPEDLRYAVYDEKNVSLSEELMEVDLDYFRTVDWPLGTVIVELAEMRSRIRTLVPMCGGRDLEQPIVADPAAFERTAINEKGALHRLATACSKPQELQFGSDDFSSLAPSVGGFSGLATNNSNNNNREMNEMRGSPNNNNNNNQGYDDKRLAALLAPGDFE